MTLKLSSIAINTFLLLCVVSGFGILFHKAQEMSLPHRSNINQERKTDWSSLSSLEPAEPIGNFYFRR